MRTSKELLFHKWEVRLRDKDSPWEEYQIRSFRRYLKYHARLEDIVNSLKLFRENSPYKLTPTQNNKGLEWLKRKALKVNGELKLSRHNPLGEREARILNNFHSIELIDLVETHNLEFNPIYRVWSKGTYSEAISTSYSFPESFDYIAYVGRMEVVR